MVDMSSASLPIEDKTSYTSLDESPIDAATNKRTRDLAICAVILDEWLKELAAISQEQSIVML